MNPNDQDLAGKIAELERRLAEVERRIGMNAAAPAAPVAGERLAELRQLGGKEGPQLIDAVIGLFLSSTTPMLGALREAMIKGDAGALRSAAHALKGTCSNLGAREMMGLCAKLEKIAEVSAFSEAAKVLDELDGEYQRVHAALESMRPGSPAQAEKTEPPAQAAKPRMSSRRAVICDDDKTLLHIVRHILEKQGFSVFEAVNGEEGLAQIRAKDPSLVLLDLDMPIKDGLAVLKELKEGGGAPGYVIVLTHHESAEVHRQVKELGASESMTKPFDPAGFARAIEALSKEGKI